MLVRPEMKALADAIWAAVAADDVEPGTPAAYQRWREGYDRFGDGLPRPAETQVVAVDTGTTGAELVTAGPGRPDGLVVFAHGGGYVFGSPVSHRGFAAHLAALAGVGVLLPDYRLSPEATGGAAVADVVAAYRHVLAEGWDPAAVTLGGDSAGGGIALAALQVLRSHGDPLPGRAVLLSPWLDMTRLTVGSRRELADEPMFDADFTIMMAAAVVGDGDPADPLVSPLLGDLAGLPPTLVHTGSGEAMRDDADLFAERAEQAGVDVALRTWPGAGHNFQMFPGFFAPDALAWEAVRDIADFLS